MNAGIAITLVSHTLCPFVQRAAIVLAEKRVPFDRRNIDLTNKPAWFLEISPMGKTPVLLVNDKALFESAVICEYLDEIHDPRLHPADALERAQHRGWIEFASQVLGAVYGLYTAGPDEAMRQCAETLRQRFETLETHLGKGPFFAGEKLSMVDAAFAPVFTYFDVIDEIADFGAFENVPRVRAWRQALASHASVKASVPSGFHAALQTHFRSLPSALARRMQEPALA